MADSFTARVRDFHLRYGQFVGDLEAEFSPAQINLGWRLLMEEITELQDAYRDWFGYGNDRELAALLKEMADVIYTVVGLGVRLGVDMDRIFALVDDSNKTKAGVDATGKVQKGESYVAPDVRGELIQQWSEAFRAAQPNP